MKLVCYGASVTAQKNDTGYFQQLVESSCASSFSSIEKVAFGASQFEYAGYSFMQDVLDYKPDICVIDWLTPSMPGFNAFKIDLLNYALLSINCLPVWVFFPRVNNFSNLPNSFAQVSDSTQQFSLNFLDLRSEMPDFLDDPKKYLRDAVHTTLDGAKCYAKAINNELKKVISEFDERLSLAKLSEGYKLTAEKKYSIPLIKESEFTIDSFCSLEIDFQYKGGFFEVYFDTDIGPHICFLDCTLYKDGELFDHQIFNKVDPWCYYKRSKIIVVLRKRIPAGNYKLVIQKGNGNPFEERETRKPVEEHWNEVDRYISVKRISATADDFKLSMNRSKK
ncbi:hypothetical protein [Alteromonas sp. M12]|uniref:hypothetical protein n=1 Tax=Alteromonas sp. M12 TaxID=3135644 RepID=UPI00319EA6B9